jgi:type II secretory pathway pseudopilin PulG
MRKFIGFTLIELLIIIGIVAFLASAIFIAVDPAKRFASSRNDRSWTDISTILEATLKYSVDRAGALPPGIDDDPATAQVLGTRKDQTCNVGCGAKTTAAGCLDLSGSLVSEYLSHIPYDPYTGSADFTGYYLNKTSNGRIEVGACDPELGATIYVSR